MIQTHKHNVNVGISKQLSDKECIVYIVSVYVCVCASCTTHLGRLLLCLSNAGN